METEIAQNSRCTILLIEDDKVDQAAFERLVKEQGLAYDYTIAGSLAQAKSILTCDKFDLAVVDYLLGDGTAFDVLQLTDDMPVIFAAGVGDEEIAVKAMKAGAYDYIIKDTRRNYLKILPQVVEKTLAQKKATDALKQYHNNLKAIVKERTEQLEGEKELLAVTVCSMTDCVIAVDVQKRIILFNKVAENLTGWKCREVQGKIIDEIFHPIDEKTKKPGESPIDKVLTSGQTENGSDRDTLITKDGSECPISATAAPIRKNDGTMVGIVMVLRDVSRQREIDRMKSDFISSVTHELRTPLTAIKAYITTILRDPDMPEQTKHEFLTVIDEESDLLKNLIEAILEVSRIESGTVKFSREPVDITAVIEQVLSAVQHLAGKKNIRLKADIADQLGMLHGDEGKIQSMVMNLVGNAIKFTPENGRVTISARRRTSATAAVAGGTSLLQKQESVEPSHELVIRVSDTGIGIPKDALPKIFDRFYRVHRPGKQIKGTGLGLAIVKEIVNMHGGRIEVESELDKGSTFTVFLPLNTQTALYV
jgi:two-component system phosphate regulon sensor histidine kinase PhoR